MPTSATPPPNGPADDEPTGQPPAAGTAPAIPPGRRLLRDQDRLDAVEPALAPAQGQPDRATRASGHPGVPSQPAAPANRAPAPQGGTAPAGRPQPGPAQPGAVQVAPLHGPWPMNSVFGKRWLGPVRPASPAAVKALLVAGLVGALSIPLDRAGIGWLVTAVAGVAALIVARAVPHKTPGTAPKPLVRWRPRALSRARFGWSAATVALLGVGTFRSAGWLFFLCLCTAVLTGAVAVAGGRSLRAMLLAITMAPLAGFRSVPWVNRGIAAAGRGDRRGNGLRIAATVAVSIALLVVFGSLFASADAAFANLIEDAIPTVSAGTVTRWIFVFFVTIFILGGAAFLRAAPPDLSGLDGPGRHRVTRLEWTVPLILLVLLFAMFVAVQLTVLFGGSKHVLDTDGLTYAEYARSGFWQLLVVTGLTLAVLAGAARWAPRDTRTDRLLIRAVLGTLAVLTLVIVASAVHRMDLYADTYGLTRLRVLVALCELWLGLTFVLVLIAGVRLKAPWLPRAVVAAGVLALLSLAVANPDRVIADRNITRYEQTGRIDTDYLSDLSPDAVPAMDRLTGDKRACALAPIAHDLATDPDDWRGWNLSRHQARNHLAANPPIPSASCPETY